MRRLRPASDRSRLRSPTCCRDVAKIMTRSVSPFPRLTAPGMTRVWADPTAVRRVANWGAHVIGIEAPAVVDGAASARRPTTAHGRRT